MSVVSVSVPEMVRPRQVGPDLPSGVRRPDRAVSLRDVREQPVQRMGASSLVWDIDGNLVNPSRPEIQSKNPKWEPAWRDWIDSRISIGEKFTPDQEIAERDRWDRETEEDFKDDPEGQAEFEKDWEPVEQPVTEIVPGYSDPADPAGWFRLVEKINAERAKNGQPPLTPEEEMKLRDGLGVEEAPPGEWAAEMQGLTADEAFQQHHAMAGGEPPREGRAHPERAPAPYEPAAPMSDEERKEATRRYKEEIEKIRRDNPGVFNPEARAEPHPNLGGPFLGEPRVPYPGQQRVPLDVVGEPGSTPPRRVPYPGQQRVPLDVVNAPPGNSRRPRFIDRPNVLNPMAGPDWEAIEEGDYGAGNWWDTVPGMDDLGDALPDFGEEDLNPELRSMDSQMLADMMVAQPEQGYFGGLGDAVQGQLGAFQNASTEEKLAIVLTGLAALSAGTGVGGPLVPPLLGGSALLNAVG